jgi:crossover junction endonuclease MUS81
VKEMFAQQLLQISGISADVACEIVKHYPTIASMLKAFAKCDSKSEMIGLFTVLQCGSSKKSIPREAARRLVNFFTAEDFDDLDCE